MTQNDKESNQKSNISGIKKTIVLLSLLGKEMSEKIIKNLPESTQKKIASEKEKIKTTTIKESQDIFNEFESYVDKKKKEQLSPEFSNDLEIIVLLSLLLLVILFFYFLKFENEYMDILEPFIDVGGAYIFIFPVVMLLARNMYNQSLISLVFKSSNYSRDTLIGLVGGLVLYTILLISQYFSDDPPPLKENSNFLIFLILAGGVLGPITEELLFRKMFYSFLKRKVNIIFGILVTSAAFSLVHLPFTRYLTFDILDFFLYGLAGIVLVFLFEYQKHLYIPVVAHSSANILVILTLLT